MECKAPGRQLQGLKANPFRNAQSHRASRLCFSAGLLLVPLPRKAPHCEYVEVCTARSLVNARTGPKLALTFFFSVEEGGLNGFSENQRGSNSRMKMVGGAEGVSTGGVWRGGVEHSRTRRGGADVQR
jgi:hypothetical protein